jgi:2-deoxy-scyllo-inosamine dehydrogenase (SAM-dependent)/8-amino-3,8-dideoxy-alpha-D-manno-octulosonate transaminase
MDTATKTVVPLFQRLMIETQSHCNRSCWFCPRTHDRSGVYLAADGSSVIESMPTERVLDLLDQAQAMGFRQDVAFYHYSEPLLDKRNFIFACAARRRGMRPYLHTNGDVLESNEDLCEEVQDVYERIVIGLYDYRTCAELEEAKRLWRERLNRVVLEFSPIAAEDGDPSVHTIVAPRALVAPDARMRGPDFVFANGPCHRPLIRMIIRYDGTVCNCCEDTGGAFDLGNAFENSLEELWFSERHLQIVQDLVAGHRQKYELCRNCPQFPTGSAATGERIDMTPRVSLATAE